MNAKFLENEVFCKGCGKSLGTGYLVKDRKYCSNKCQQIYESELYLEDWLKTGRFRNFTGGKAGHSNRARTVITYLSEQQNNKCAICNIANTWKGSPLIFVLDHKDGDYTNNTRSNLRLICPNCDSQTSTFKGRNKGNGRKGRYSH